MANSNKKSKLEKNSLSSASTTINVRDTHTEELVFGLCGPIGSPLHEVSAEIQSILADQFGYECRTIKLSKFIEENKGKVRKEPRFERVQELIDKGNALRDEHGKSILVDFAIHEIALDREKNKMKSGAGSYKSRRVCHVIDSIKNQEELEALRVVYGDMFFFIGVFSPILVREKKLKDMGMELKEVYQLIDRDSGEEVDYGQTVEGTFPKSDFFLRVDSESLVPVKSKLERFLKIIFGVEISTPSSGEKAMYLASSAAGNSACLSRELW